MSVKHVVNLLQAHLGLLYAHPRTMNIIAIFNVILSLDCKLTLAYYTRTMSVIAIINVVLLIIIAK